MQSEYVQLIQTCIRETFTGHLQKAGIILGAGTTVQKTTEGPCLKPPF